MQMSRHRKDPYRLHRIALLATDETLPDEAIRHVFKDLSPEDLHDLVTFILSQGLACFWLEALRVMPDLPFSRTDRETIRTHCFRYTTRYLAQKKTLLETDRIFEGAGITYTVFKGALTREVIYTNPAFRHSADIDILISPADKFRVITLLCDTGYALNANRANVSNEVTLSKDNVHLDLHWHIMRPGRPRADLTELYLQSRLWRDFFWGLDNETALLVLLTHPVFTEYSTGPGSSVLKLADLGRWIARQEIDWQRVLHLLEISGMKTAAWITATLLANLTRWHLPSEVYHALRPGRFKQLILLKWLALNLSAQLINLPFIPKYTFTLLAHDSFQDIVRFIRIYLHEKRQSDALLQQLLSASTCHERTP